MTLQGQIASSNTQLAAKVRSEFKVPMSVAQVFTHRTVVDMAGLVPAASKRASANVIGRPVGGGAGGLAEPLLGGEGGTGSNKWPSRLHAKSPTNPFVILLIVSPSLFFVYRL